ncbi:MAG: squalene synthase HpnC [Pseudomonadota bacterium]|nr:squalene synthase HpnC [Pseudomonadota bacterium]
MNTASPVETPSGKWSGDENFPVGSWLLPAPLRPHVALFYAVARTTDDIADNPGLTPEDKLARLHDFEQAVRGDIMDDPAYVKSFRLRLSLIECGVTDRHICDLIAAFKQDATKLRYDDWGDLIGYCNLSAAPVGRYLLDLHGEDPADYAASDPLCNALQVLNHLQDLKEDFRELDRVYLPGDWMEKNGVVVADLAAEAASPGMRIVIDKALDGVDDMMARARTLPGRLKNRRLAMESAVIVRLADRLTDLLRKGDPIAGRVALTKLDFMSCGLRGMAAGWMGG